MLTAREIRALLTPVEFEVLLEIDRCGWIGVSVEVLNYRTKMTEEELRLIVRRLLNLELLTYGGHVWYAPQKYVCKPDLVKEVELERE